MGNGYPRNCFDDSCRALTLIRQAPSPLCLSFFRHVSTRQPPQPLTKKKQFRREPGDKSALERQCPPCTKLLRLGLPLESVTSRVETMSDIYRHTNPKSKHHLCDPSLHPVDLVPELVNHLLAVFKLLLDLARGVSGFLLPETSVRQVSEKMRSDQNQTR